MRSAVANNLRALRLITVLCAFTLPVPLIEAEWAESVVLVVAGVSAFGVSLLANRIAPAGDLDRRRLSVVREVAVSWFVVSFGAAVVTVALARVADTGSGLEGWSDALFETISGLTTTGLTMVPDVETIGPTLQWWRSALQIVGAIGVVVFGLLVAEESGDDNTFFGVQWGQRPADDPGVAARRIVTLLLGLIAVSFVALVATGEDMWAGLNHATTAASTGGFSITSDSARSLGAASKVVLMVTFVIPAMSFATLWGALRRQGCPAWRRTQVRWTLGVTCTTGVLALVVAGWDRSPLDVLFDAVSAATTTGFASGSLFEEVPALALLTTISMAIGGSVGSTAGGLKVARVAWLGKAMWRWLPVGGDIDREPYRWDDRSVEIEEAKRRIIGAGSLVALFLVTAVATTLVLLVSTEAGVGEAVFEAVSALSNVGLSIGVTDPDASGWARGVLMVAMLLGRVEITGFVAIVAWSARRRHT